MNSNVRRFAAAVSVTILLSMPALAAPASRDRDSLADRPGLVRVVKRLMQRLANLIPTDSLPTGPIPAPSTSNP